MRIDATYWRWVPLRFVPWLTALNLAWESAHLPLYTLWRESSAPYIAYSVIHCTAGDVLIGTSALLLSVMLVPRRQLVIPAMAALALAYTLISEWLNTAVLDRWAYSELMPVLQVQSLRFGLSPLLQVLVLPAGAALLAGYLMAIKTGVVGGGHTMATHVD